MTDHKTTNDLIDLFYATINGKDFDAFAAVLDENLHFEMIGSTRLSGKATSREGMMGVIGRVAECVDDNFIHLTEVARVVDGNKGVMRSMGKAKTRDGRRYDNTYMHMITVRDGKIVEFIEYLDTDLIRRVLVGKEIQED